MKYGIVRFPGSCDETDALLAARRAGDAVLLWHGEHDLQDADALIVPGGFSYGDYLRVGAIARFAPIMREVEAFARAGGPVLGICNGFQVLCEAGLLPGALLPNVELKFVCRQVDLTVERADTAWTRGLARGAVLSIPAKHQAGRYHAPALPPQQVVFRYADGHCFNGSQDAIAGVCNEAGNVVGLMPHPEHAVDLLTGSADGLRIIGAPAAVAA